MTASHHPGTAAGARLCAVCTRAWPCPDAPAGRHRHPYSTEATVPARRGRRRQLQATDANPDRGPRCGECRLGLGVHTPADPLCTQHVDVVGGLANALDRILAAHTVRDVAGVRTIGVTPRMLAETLVRTPEFVAAAQRVEVVAPYRSPFRLPRDVEPTTPRLPALTGHTWGDGRPKLRAVEAPE